MGYEWGRLVWWLNQNAGAVQALMAIVSVAMTGILCYVTFRYVQLTKRLVETSSNQLRVSVHPMIRVELAFGGGQDSAGGVVFKDQVTIRIFNVGSSAVIVRAVTLEYDVSDDPDDDEAEVRKDIREAIGFRNVVITPPDSCRDTVRVSAKVNDFPSWADWVSVTALCGDIGGLISVRYFYRKVDGLKLLI